MACTSKSRKNISLADKVSIIREIQNGKKQVDIAQEKSLPKSTIQTIWSSKEKILKDYMDYAPTAKRARNSEFPKVDDALSKWFDSQRSQNVPLNGPLMIEKAKELAQKLNEPNFKGSSGWFENWKRRKGITFCAISGEAAAVDDNVVTSWLEKVWPDLKAKFSPKDIFNCDETGLFYKLLPNKTLQRKGEVCTGGKLSKERLTLLLCCNADGSEKLKPLVIGKYDNPRCFKAIKKGALPVHYESNKKSWMTQALFTDWLKKVNLRMRFARRNILLLLDNCSAHVVKCKLSNITVEFFPPNVTAKLQPLDLGIINETKKNYRRVLIRKLIESLDKGKPFQIDMLEAIMNISLAWNQVPSLVIKNCFKHSKMMNETEDDNEVLEDLPEDDLPANVDFGDATIDDYVSVDSNVLTFHAQSEDEIVEELLGEGVGDPLMEDSSSSEGEEDPEIDRQPSTAEEALRNLEAIKLFLLNNEDEEDTIFQSLLKIEGFIMKKKITNLRQATLEHFFPSANP